MSAQAEILIYPLPLSGLHYRALLARLGQREHKEDRVLYVIYPLNGGYRAERLVADDSGELDRAVVSQAGESSTEHYAREACRWDWEDFVRPVIMGEPYKHNHNKAPTKVPFF